MVHCIGGRLLVAAKRVWETDVNKENQVVQSSITTPISGCTIIAFSTHPQVKRKINDVSNVTNQAMLATTALERYHNVPNIEAGFDRQKLQHSWSDGSIGAPALEAKKLLYSNSLYPTQSFLAYRPLEYQCVFLQSEHAAQDDGHRPCSR